MFHYRWAFAADVARAAAILPRWFRTNMPDQQAIAAGQTFAQRFWRHLVGFPRLQGGRGQRR